MEELLKRDELILVQGLFEPGRILATAAAADLLNQFGVSKTAPLLAHMSGIWGNVSFETVMSNMSALRSGGELFSVQVLETGEEVWIVTDWSRSTTTVMVPNELTRSELIDLMAR